MLRALLLLLCSTCAYAESAEVAGVVSYLQGAAFANRSNSSANLAKDQAIRVGDHIVTGHGARVQLKMVDDTVLTLGADTEFVITQYHYAKAAQQGSAGLELIRGVFRAVTGAIGKLQQRDFKVKTSVATIGIRGTDFWGGFYFSHAFDVALLDGKGIYIDNAAGHVEISQIGYGSTIETNQALPSTPIAWGEAKLQAAQRSVTLDAK